MIAAVNENAVQGTGAIPPTGSDNGTGATTTNSPGSAPIGDNAGAFGRGFTTGADAYGVTINKTTGVVQISVDQRFININSADIFLLQANGQVASYTPSSSSPSCDQNTTGNYCTSNNSFSGTFNTPEGPETVTLQYTPAEVANAIAIQLEPRAFDTPLDISLVSDSGSSGADWFNVKQILAPLGSSAHLKAASVKHHTKKHTKKHHKKH